MRTAICFWTAMVLCQTASWRQAQAEDAPDIRVLLQAIQSQLDAQDQADQGDKRATRIGGATRRVLPFEEGMVVRIYDASDLFVVSPSYIARHDSDLAANRKPLFPTVSSGQVSGVMGGGGFGGGGGPFNIDSTQPQLSAPLIKTLHQFDGSENVAAPIDARAARVSLEDLVDAITTTISPDTWSDVGGEGSISIIGSSLLISQTESIHGQITSLMNLFRERWGSLRTVSVVANWIWLKEPELDSLLAQDAEAHGLVDQARWRNFRAAPAAQNERPGYSATITCQNGQTVHVLAGGQTLAVTNLTPVVGSQKAAAYQPAVSLIQEGAALQVTPISNRSGKFVTLDVHSRVTLLNDVEHREQQGKAEIDAVVAAIDRPQVLSQRLSTTLRLPVGQTMLVGGMTFAGQPTAQDPNLYLFVTVVIQELRDDLDEAKPDPDVEPNAEPNGASAKPELNE